jgi:hypothetical protein
MVFGRKSGKGILSKVDVAREDLFFDVIISVRLGSCYLSQIGCSRCENVQVEWCGVVVGLNVWVDAGIRRGDVDASSAEQMLLSCEEGDVRLVCRCRLHSAEPAVNPCCRRSRSSRTTNAKTDTHQSLPSVKLDLDIFEEIRAAS